MLKYCHVGHTGSHLITAVKQRLARIVLVWVTTQMTSTPSAVGMCTRNLWPEKASKKTPRRVFPPGCTKYLKNTRKCLKIENSFTTRQQQQQQHSLKEEEEEEGGGLFAETVCQ
jgi:hypothetical protein